MTDCGPLCGCIRIQNLLGGAKPDGGMATALPPGAWWESATTMSSLVVEPYGADAGDAAVQAARSGPLELRNICFTYPLRPSAHGMAPCTIFTRLGKWHRTPSLSAEAV